MPVIPGLSGGNNKERHTENVTQTKLSRVPAFIWQTVQLYLVEELEASTFGLFPLPSQTNPFLSSPRSVPIPQHPVIPGLVVVVHRVRPTPSRPGSW